LPQAELNDAQRLACLQLIRSQNVGPVTFRDLINHYGGARQALATLPEIYMRSGRSGRSRQRFAICPPERARAELAAAARIGAKPVFTIEPGYPAALAAIEAPPPLLYVKGDAALLARPAIAIVGSRNASAAGHKLTRHFAGELGSQGFVITSGLARGIDGTAHKAAMATGTIAVVAGGLDVIYPPEHEKLQNEIGQSGCLISEMPPGFKPRAKDFPRRNRIIAGISLGVIVIEAARRSGTLITARMAAEQGREVFAIPGHPLDPRAEGTNHLLKSGATLATCPGDVIKTLRPMLGGVAGYGGPAEPGGVAESGGRGQLLEAPSKLAAPLPEPRPVADDDRSRVAEALGPAPINIDEIARATDLSIRTVQVIVMEMDLAGCIERHGQQLVSLRPIVDD